VSEWTTVVGTLAGAALGGGITYLTQRAAWDRQDARRWDEVTLTATVQFLAVCDRIADQCADLDPYKSDGAPIEAEDMYPWRREVEAAMVELELVSAEQHRDALLQLRDATFGIMRAVVDESDRTEPFIAFNTARANLLEAARSGLR
jgi:hypothetical protein